MKAFHVSFVATEATDAEGHPLVRGETLKLSEKALTDPHNQRLIDEGQLVAIEDDDNKKGGSDE